MLPAAVHPAFVHFPLAMLAACWVCLLAVHRGLDAKWDERARLFEVVGVAFLPVTIAAGFFDDGGFAALLAPDWGDPLSWHVAIALAASAMAGAHWWWRRRLDLGQVRDAVAIDLGLSTAWLWAFLAAGAVAGEMVHG